MNNLFNSYHKLPQSAQLCGHLSNLASSPFPEVFILSIDSLTRLFPQFISIARESPEASFNLRIRSHDLDSDYPQPANPT